LRDRPACAIERFIDDTPRLPARAAPRPAEAAPRAADRAAPRALEAARPRPVDRRVREPLEDADEERPRDDERLPDDRPDARFFDEPEELRERDDLPEERRELEDFFDDRPERPPTGSAPTAFLAMSAIVPAAEVTTDPTVLAAVPTPDATVSSIPPPLFSSAIVPPRRRTPSTRR